MTIIQQIKSSGAFKNPFFAGSAISQAVPLRRLATYAGNWFEVTRTFGLFAASYLSVVSRAIKAEGQAGHPAALERVLQQAASIAYDDLGGGRGTENQGTMGAIHYRMFEEMCRPVRSFWPATLEDETQALTATIERMFSLDVSSGIAVFAVVETIAWNIVNAQKPLFLSAQNCGLPVFLEKDLGYIDLHLQIEGAHSEESGSLVDGYLESFPENQPVVQGAAEMLCQRFESFWQAMDRVVFASQ